MKLGTADAGRTAAGLATGADRLPDVRRINFRFSGRGRYLACLADHGHGRLAPEMWDLTDTGRESRELRVRDEQTPMTVPMATDDGNLLLCHIGTEGVHRVLLAVPSRGGGRPEEHELGTVLGNGLGVVAGRGGGTAAVAFATGVEQSRVLRLSGRPEPPELVTVLPDLVGGGIWLDENGTRLAVRSMAGTGTAVLDLARGALEPLTGLSGDEHLLLAAPRTGALLTAARRDGAYRLGVRLLHDDRPTVFPDRLNAIEGSVTPLALSPDGRRLALAVTRRARSHLLLHDLVGDVTEESGLPGGTLFPLAHWGDTHLHLIHTTPDRPPGPITVSRRTHRIPSVPEPSRPRWAGARVHTYDGPAGAIEAVVYGEPATAAQVVIALHGGPEAAWQLGFDPLFQSLAAEGIAVVAPNQRGSTGYGAAHRDAIQGVWGGPDLDDVLHLGRALGAARGPLLERPALYGASYGAYLALLAAAARPELWARAAVVAPFLSGRELYEDGPPTVRTMLDRLGGREEIHDDLGPRDLLMLADRLRTPLLIVHGERDPIIPVSHSRRLRDRLLRSRHHGVGPAYLEIPGAGHDPLSESDGKVVRDGLVGFLRTGTPPSA
ncbi:alpha/beta hydrolase family protein [Streptosporangium jomthongense]|uniref:Alpha/beta hydrolase family protein n=1 Tax=Streptosporangium jomthongense TaxID=1193683 RepID=A0ABV8ESQ2_9ACTN